MGGGGLVGACSFILRGNIIDGTPHNLCAVRICASIVCMQLEPNTEMHVFVFFGGGGGGEGLGEM